MGLASTDARNLVCYAQAMTEDLVAIWHALFPAPSPAVAAEEDPAASSSSTEAAAAAPAARVAPSAAADPRATLIVGHSMGGAAAVWAAASRRIPGLCGCVVVDVVEGTALGEQKSGAPRRLAAVHLFQLD